MELIFDYYGISLLVGGFSAILFGAVVFLNNRKKYLNKVWLALTMSTAVWSFGYFFMTVVTDESVALISNYILHAAAILIPLFFFLLVLVFTDTLKQYKKLFYLFCTSAVFFLIVNPTTYYVEGVFPKGPFNFAPEAGVLYIYYTLYFFLLVLMGVGVLIAEIIRTNNSIYIQRLKYIIYFTIMAVVGGGSVFFLTFNIDINPYTLILFSLYPIVSGYAILKFQLFDTKIIVTQLLVFSLWIFLLVRLLLASDFQDRMIESVLFLISVALGVFIIKSVKREVEQREKIEKLAEDLEKANKRLKELDEMKTEFLSLATHQIRSPLSAIRGYASMMLEEDYGKVPDELKEPVEVIHDSAKGLVDVVNDFLDVSRIEQGRMQYDMEDVNIIEFVKETTDEYMPNAKEKGLEINVDAPEDMKVVVSADPNKLKQVIANVVDNSIKYTTEGNIGVSFEVKGRKVLVKVKDTGVGINKEEILKLFQKFQRAKGANKVSVTGTGLGMYLAKKIIEDHKGRIWVESDGEGKGSTFIVELPVKG